MRRVPIITLSALLLIVLLITFGCSSGGDNKTTNPPPAKGEAVLWADTLYSAAGNQAQVNLYAAVRSSILNLHLPILFTGSGIRIDSVTYDKGILRKTPFITSDAVTQSGNGVYIVREYTTADYVEADSGMLATVHITIDQFSGAQTVTVDTSASVGSMQLLAPNGEDIATTFGGGKITVFDKSSVWIDSIASSPGEVAIVDINSRLTRPLQGMGLALKVVGTDITLDSISFKSTLLAGTPQTKEVVITDSTSTITTANIIRIYRRENFIPPDSGKIARIFLTLGPSSASQSVKIDTVTFVPSNFFFVDTLEIGSVPFFTPGAVEVSSGR